MTSTEYIYSIGDLVIIHPRYADYWFCWYKPHEPQRYFGGEVVRIVDYTMGPGHYWVNTETGLIDEREVIPVEYLVPYEPGHHLIGNRSNYERRMAQQQRGFLRRMIDCIRGK